MPVSKKRKDIKHLKTTGECKTLKAKQMQNGYFHAPKLKSLIDRFGLKALAEKMNKRQAEFNIKDS